VAKKPPQKDPGLFGNFFDLNGDGKTDAAEMALMFMMFDEMQQEEDSKRNSKIIRDNITDLDDLDIVGI